MVWDFKIQTDPLIQTKRLSFVNKKKNCQMMDVSLPFDHRANLKKLNDWKNILPNGSQSHKSSFNFRFPQLPNTYFDMSSNNVFTIILMNYTYNWISSSILPLDSIPSFRFKIHPLEAKCLSFANHLLENRKSYEVWKWRLYISLLVRL